jgi:putative two-component system response regulator
VASLAEFRDADTGYHIRRTKSYVEELAGCLAERPGSGLGADFVELLTKSAPLHDIGKIGVPDQILCKPGRLTPEEYEVMKRHATIGRDALLRSERQLGSNGFLRLAAEVAYSHQERWDGSGYPLGLKGDAIPLSGRIMAVADVYDALISRRPYKQPVDHESAVAYIQSNRGRLFDPQVVDALVERAERFRAIAARYADAQPALEPAPPSAERPADAPQAQTQGRHV